ncbi:hypothetical protein ABT234_28735 [Streptomyces sp. NPDC001586]
MKQRLSEQIGVMLSLFLGSVVPNTKAGVSLYVPMRMLSTLAEAVAS